ncbi:MAG: LON peptidase substrate-binding domain-containing protein [Rubrobacteridae bacterium]|nr:LON peptidase substrate-binding domain-containing protein [Rubrobacteridae bacterium]
MHELDREEVVIPKEIALIPLRDIIIFPNLVVPLFVGREKSIAALEAAMKDEHIVALVTQKQAELQDPEPEDLYKIGSAVVIMQELKIPDGTAKALVEGLSRIEIEEFIQTEPYFKVRVKVLPEETEKDIEIEALMRNLVIQFERAASLGKPIPQEVLLATANIEEPGRLADFIAFHLNLKIDEKQQLKLMSPFPVTP